MLTDLDVWNFIKQRLGIPYTFFELDYDETIKYLKFYTLKEFSRYCPRKCYRSIDPNLRISDGTYKIFETDDYEIISVVNLYGARPHDIIAGAPYNPYMVSFYEINAYLAELTMAKTAMKFSNWWKITYEFYPPNTIRFFPPIDIAGSYNQLAILELEMQHTEFSTIPAQFHRYLLDLCIADIKQLLGEIRSKYTDLQTPFGTINLNADTLKSEADTIRSAVIEKLETLPPNISVRIS